MGTIKDPELLQKIEDALAQLRPFLEADGGNIDLVEVSTDYIAKVRLLGACSSCSMSMMTIKSGVEDAVKKAVPQIKSVEAINN
jgi:Fe-S cluster biogenesis protein NfuA